MASFDFSIIYHDKDREGRTLCFTHAVQAAVKGHMIEPEIDEFNLSGNDMRDISCGNCTVENAMARAYVYQNSVGQQWWFRDKNQIGEIGPFESRIQAQGELEEYRNNVLNELERMTE